MLVDCRLNYFSYCKIGLFTVCLLYTSVTIVTILVAMVTIAVTIITAMVSIVTFYVTIVTDSFYGYHPTKIRVILLIII